MPETDPVDRIAVGLHPRTPEVEQAAAAMVRNLAAELGDLDLVEAIADEVETPEGLGTDDVAARSGITVRQLNSWRTAGYVNPLPRTVETHGYPVRFPTSAILKVRVMGSLVNTLGMKPGNASDLADQILTNGSAKVGRFVVTTRGLS